MLCLQLGRGREAREHLATALEIQPGNATARAGLADHLTVNGNYGAAAEMLQPAIQRGAITPNIAVAYARCKTGLNAADSALPVIDQALNLQGINSSNVVQLLFARGDLQDKLRQYDEAFSKPENSDALNALGELLGAMGRIDDAADAFEKALKARPGFSEARMNLAMAMTQTGRIDEAKAQCESVIASNPAFAPGAWSRPLWPLFADPARVSAARRTRRRKRPSRVSE